ncbi:hypothetical protein D3C84_605440 [compost metagenome]
MQDAVHVVDHLVITQACPPAHARQHERAATHVLGTCTDGNIGIAQQNRLGRRDNRLQTRTTQAVDVEGRGFLRDT